MVVVLIYELLANYFYFDYTKDDKNHGFLKYGFCKKTIQVPFCEEKNVQLFRVAFFHSDFLQNPHFSSSLILSQSNSKKS